MKFLVIGDVHGREHWEDIILANQDVDKVIFIGDYFDTYESDVTPEMEINNFKKILEYKREDPDNIILLFGNHDYHYLKGTTDRYSRYIFSDSEEISTLINEAFEEGLFQLAYNIDDIVISHAGFSITWVKKKLNLKNEPNPTELVDKANQFLIENTYGLDFDKNKTYSSYGDDKTQSPIWIRPQSLMANPVYGIHQIIGHTRTRRISTFDNSKFSVTLVDNLESGEYIIIEDGELEIKQIKLD